MSLKLGIYVSSFKVVEKTTGVGKHAIGMIKALISNKNVEIFLFGSYELKNNPTYVFKNLDFYPIPYKTRLLELSWKIFKLPKVDSFIPNVDAIYIPGEEQVISRKHKIFYTIHDIYQFHDKSLSIRKRILLRAYERYVRKNINKVITVSEFSKKDISALLNIELKDIIVLGNALGFDSEKNNTYGKNKIDFGYERYVVIGGPIHKKKGGDEIIKLSSELKKNNSDLKIYVTGGVDKNFEESYKKANLSNTKVFEILNVSEIVKMVKNALCYIQLSNYESFGMMVIEAMYLGTPVIISDIPGLKEVSKGNSIICNNNDTELIISKIKKLENDTNYRSQIVRKGVMHASNFKWDNFANKLIKKIEKSISI